ncbi:MAG: purine-nucleoside phosphorylase [Spirochaetales bacterium]|nr:purine-nucleoside phosphorylase [Spirochaetales bacterium]
MVRNYFKKVEQTVHSIFRIARTSPSVGIILGSGLGDFIDTIKGTEIPYSRIKGFPKSCIRGQKGILKISDVAAVFSGRFHYYEGYSMPDVVLPIFVLHKLGVKQVIITNAAGGINPVFNPGDLVFIKDHINLMGANPLRGPYEKDQGVQFPDMTDAYSRKLRSSAKGTFAAKVPFASDYKEGVYAALAGPNYETPAEINMLKKMGADMVGMSTVPEVIAAASLSLEVLGISCIVNKAAGLTDKKITHDEVIEIGKKANLALSSFIVAFCKDIGYELI